MTFQKGDDSGQGELLVCCFLMSNLQRFSKTDPLRLLNDRRTAVLSFLPTQHTVM
jgi:hypothetical protein